MHDVALNVPVLLVVKVTVPVGVIAPVPEESATVTLHESATLSRTLAEHDTVVLLDLIVEASVNVPLLPVWTLSPP